MCCTEQGGEGSCGWLYTSPNLPQASSRSRVPRIISSPKPMRQHPIIWQPLEKLEHWLHGPNLSLSRRSLGFIVCYLLSLQGARGRGYGKDLHVRLNCYLCSQWLPIWSPFLLVFRFRQHRNQSLRKPPEESECWLYGPVLSFLPQKESRSWRFPPTHMVLCGGRDCGEGVSQIVLLASMWLVCVHLGCRCFSTGFWISHKWNWSVYCCWISVSMEGRRAQSFLCHCLADATFPFNYFFCLFRCLVQQWYIHILYILKLLKDN